MHIVNAHGLMGKAPVGYLNKQVKGHGVIVVDETNAPFIQKAFALYTSGLYTMKAVSLELSKLGFNDNNGDPYNVSKIERILKNIVYTGKIKYGKNDDGTDRIIQGVHEPIISLSLFNKAEAMRRNGGKPNTKHTDKNKNSTSILFNFLIIHTS